MRYQLGTARCGLVGRNNSGVVDAVLVARWSDGVELWRTKLADPDESEAIHFAWGKGDYWPAANFYVESLVSSRTSLRRSSTYDDLLPFVDHARWILPRLGLRRSLDTPMWGSVDSLDPSVARFALSLEEARRQARHLDARMEAVHAEAARPLSMAYRWKATAALEGEPFAAVAKQMVGQEDLVDEVLDFLDGLLDPVWLKAAPATLKKRGVLQPVLLRPTSPDSVRRRPSAGDGTVAPPGWATTSSLDLQSAPRGAWTLTSLIDWLGVGLDDDEMETQGLLVFPPDEFERWFEGHTLVGELSISREEVEVLDLLGEALPYLWSAERLRAWAEERVALEGGS